MGDSSPEPSTSDDPGEPLARAGQEWSGLPVALWAIPDRGELVHHHRTRPVLLVARSGVGRRWYRSGTARCELSTAPRMIELYGAGFTLDHGRWEGTRGACVGVEFPIAALTRFLGDRAHRFDPATRHEVFDEQVADLVFALWQEASSGASNGPLYADGLSLSLLGLMCAHGLAPPVARASVPTLSGDERRRIHQFVDAALGENLSVDQLAAVAGMSAFHFARVFKATFGCTPHRFVLDRRLEGAATALRVERDRPIADIALAFGFASQAHFTQAFRLRIGTTPARWRRQR
jgi:AraC family transcriptional regulator